MEASLSQQYKHSFQYQVSYTWARLLTLVPGFTLANNNVDPTGDEINLRAGYGPDSYTRPQRFVLSGLYNLPGPTNNHLLEEVIGGWSVATATVIQNGQPMSMFYTSANNAYGSTTDRASFAAGCTAANLPTSGSVGSRAVKGYINKACLAVPAALVDSGGTETSKVFGNTSNGIVPGPGQVDVDLSLSKTAQVHWPMEGANVNLRADFFNAFNHPNFGNPNTTYSPTSTAFGYISTMTTNPRVIQFALRYSF